MSRPVTIVDYNPMWPIVYEEEKHQIQKKIGHKIVKIEHMGSTSIHGLGGKPIIDIITGVLNYTDADECVTLLQDLGYTDVTPEPEEPDWYYCLGKKYQGKSDQIKNFHLHLAKYPSHFYNKHLIFRNYLRTHPKVSQQYFELKKGLASEYGSNREGYTEAKNQFIKSITTQAIQKEKINHI